MSCGGWSLLSNAFLCSFEMHASQLQVSKQMERVIEKLTRVRMLSASPISLLLGIPKQPPNIRIRRKGEHVLRLAARILCVILLLSDCSRLIFDVEDYLSVIIEIIKGLWQPQRASCSIESSM